MREVNEWPAGRWGIRYAGFRYWLVLKVANKLLVPFGRCLAIHVEPLSWKILSVDEWLSHGLTMEEMIH
jgi:hypothetical protein